MLPIQKQISDFNHSPRTEKIKYINVHDVGEVSSAKNNAIYFNGGDRQSSADFFVDSNNIFQIVDYKNYFSWAVGDGHGKYGITNGNSLSIEMCLEADGQPSQATINNTLDLIRSLISELNLPLENIVRHFDASGKICPQSFSANNWAKWFEFKSKILIPNIDFKIDMFAHIQDLGNVNTTGINECSMGTVGQSKRIEAIAINIDGVDLDYKTHIQNIGDINGQSEGQIEGTMGQSKRLEAITINVKSIPQGYKLQYQAHVQNIGWQDWKNSGELAGTERQSLRMESLKIRIVKVV